MYNEHKTRTTRWQWLAILGVVGALLVTSPVPGYAWYRGRVFIRPSVVVPLGPYWGPYYWEPYPYYPPPVVVTPPPVYVQPAPQVQPTPQTPDQPPAASSFWYYCENPQGYYPYVQQCPDGWQPVAPTPQSP
jgi:hypothetical protein